MENTRMKNYSFCLIKRAHAMRENTSIKASFYNDEKKKNNF